MRLVLDTNVLISAFGWGGVPGQLLLAGLAGQFEICTSQHLSTEVERVLSYPQIFQALFKRGLSAQDVYRKYLASALWFEPQPLPQPVSRDADDDHVLACALAARADLIVSGDDDLLSLGAFENIPIVTTSTALNHIGKSA